MNRGMPPPPSKRRQAAAVEDAVAEAGSLAVDGIEVVQVVQDISHSVALIAGKPTIVRVYLSRPAGSAVTVRGEISVRRTASGAAQNVPSLDTARVRPTQNGELRVKREDFRLSLNFSLPSSLITAGRIFVRVASLAHATTGDRIDCTNCDAQQLEVRFKEAAPLRVRLIKIRYRTDTKPSGYIPTARDAALFKSWIGRAYPVSKVIVSENTVESAIQPPFDDDTCNLVNAQLTAIRNLDIDGGSDQRSHYYGMVSDEGEFMRGGANNIPDSADPTAVASGPTGSSGYAWDTDGSYGDWYGAHELAHTFGRFHPGFCNGNSDDDDNFPFGGGQLSNGDGAFVGLDVGDQALGVPMKVLPGHRWHDVMTYCSRQWMSSYTFEGIRRRLAAEDALGPSPAAEGFEFEDEGMLAAASALEVNMASGDFVNVVATINLTQQTGKILYVNPVSRALTSAPVGESNVEIRVLNADGQNLQAVLVRVKFNTCADSSRDQIGIVDAIIPSHPDARQLELLIEGHVVDTFRAGVATPDVSNLRREEMTESMMSFAWDAPADAEPAKISYNIQSSTDDGNTWQTIAVGRSSPNLSIDRSQYPPGSRVTVRVIATDGFINTITTSETFTVDEPPE